ncbi:hypothetical protein Bca101_022907 [Brassica carinata]
MSRIWGRVAGLFRSKSFIGADKTGNKYFSRMEQIDGLGEYCSSNLIKEKRWVVFRREEDPTSIPVEWICWLNGQRKRAPTPEEMAELDARRERVKLNVALLKKEEEEKKAREGTGRKITSIGDKAEEASKEADQSRAKEQEPEIVTAEPPEPK